MTVRQLLASLDSAELTEWMAFLELQRDAETKGENVDDQLKKILGAHNG